MGTFTFENFLTEIRFDLKNRPDTASSGLSDSRLGLFLNAAYLHVTHPTVFKHRELKHSYTIPLVTGTNTYAFSPNAGISMTALRYVSHVAAATDDLTARRVKLFAHDEQWFQERSHNDGAPRDYCVRGNNLILSPIPSANENGQVLSVGTWREPTLLVAGATTVLSSIWDEIILLASRWRAELHLGYRDLAEATKLDFSSLINEYQDFDTLHNEDWDWSTELRSESSMETV